MSDLEAKYHAIGAAAIMVVASLHEIRAYLSKLPTGTRIFQATITDIHIDVKIVVPRAVDKISITMLPPCEFMAERPLR